MDRVLILFWLGVLLIYIGIFLAIFGVEHFYFPAAAGLVLCISSFCAKE